MAHAMTFDEWKQLLQSDCVSHDKLPAFQAMNDYVLKLLYDSGLDPTVGSIAAIGERQNEST
jgi:hypothetical protein